MAVVSGPRRDSITILADVLKAINFSKFPKKTTIVYKANLNFERIKKYMDLLVATGHVEIISATNGEKSYKITAKGQEFLLGYDRLIASLKRSLTQADSAVIAMT